MVPLDAIEVGVNCHLPVCGHAPQHYIVASLPTSTALGCAEKRNDKFRRLKAQIHKLFWTLDFS